MHGGIGGHGPGQGTSILAQESQAWARLFWQLLFTLTLHHQDGETMGTVSDFIFLGSTITVGGDCSHEIKRKLLLGRKAVTKPRQHIQKQRHHFADTGLYSQSYGFPVVM